MKIGDLVAPTATKTVSQNDLFVVVKVLGNDHHLRDDLIMVICQNISTGWRTKWGSSGNWRLV